MLKDDGPAYEFESKEREARVEQMERDLISKASGEPFDGSFDFTEALDAIDKELNDDLAEKTERLKQEHARLEQEYADFRHAYGPKFGAAMSELRSRLLAENQERQKGLPTASQEPMNNA